MFLHRKFRKWSNSWNLGSLHSSLNVLFSLITIEPSGTLWEIIYHPLCHGMPWFSGLCWKATVGVEFITVKIIDHCLPRCLYALWSVSSCASPPSSSGSLLSPSLWPEQIWGTARFATDWERLGGTRHSLFLVFYANLSRCALNQDISF